MCQGILTNTLHAIWYGYIFQLRTGLKSFISNTLYPVRNLYGFQLAAAVKGASRYIGDSIRQFNLSQTHTTAECITAYFHDRFRDIDACKAFTA